MAKLIKEFDILKKSKIKAGEGKETGKYPFFTSSDTKVLYLDNYMFDDELVIIGTGGKPSCNYYNGKFSVSTDNFVFKKKPNGKILPRYLYYFLKKDNYFVLQDGFHGAGLEHIGKKYIENIEIPNLDKSQQEKLIKELDLINKVINIKENELNYYDELIDSKFNASFGDVLSNDKKFDTCPFKKFETQMNIGPFGSSLTNDCFVDKKLGYCMVYEQKHAIEKNIDINNRYVTKEKYESLKRFEVFPGDIIVSCRGTIGQCYLLPQNAEKGIIHPSLMMIRPNDSVNKVFLLYLLQRILAEQNDQGSGVKMAIKAKDLEKIITINPPRSLQDNFCNFIDGIKNIKTTIKDQIQYLYELLNKKMDQYIN